MALAVANEKLIVKGGSLGTGAECCCGPPPPPPPPPCLGACCVNGVCIRDTQEVCADLGGTWFGCDTECSESLCSGDKEDCVDDCCPEVPAEILVTVVVAPVTVCYAASINPFGTIFVRAVIEEFAASETLTLPLALSDPCPIYYFTGIIDGVRYTVQVNLSVNADGICVWSIPTLSVSKCSQANTEDGYQSACPSLNKYGVGVAAGGAFPDLGVTGCVGGTVISIPVLTGFDSDAFCDPVNNRICEGNAANCEPAETTVTVTIAV